MAQQTTADDRTAANLNTADWSSEDWAEFNAHPSENNHYVSTSGNITRHCPRCGYEGTHDHPRRSRPTFHATLRHYCPDAKCGALLESGPAEDEQEDGEDDDERGRQVPRITFQRDDGQLMYVEPDGLYTSGSHAPFVGHVQRLTVSTTATTALPSR